MDSIYFIFNLGVIFTIFWFIWWLISIGFTLIRGFRTPSKIETYVLRMLKYYFQVEIVFLFCSNKSAFSVSNYIIAGLVMLTYFINRLNIGKVRNQFFSVKTINQNQIFNQIKPVYDFKLEVSLIVLSTMLFVLLFFYPSIANNVISLWIFDTIIELQKAPIFGFIFNLIGFFFVAGLFVKFIQSFSAILDGSIFRNTNIHHSEKDKFDDYEEL